MIKNQKKNPHGWCIKKREEAKVLILPLITTIIKLLTQMSSLVFALAVGRERCKVSE